MIFKTNKQTNNFSTRNTQNEEENNKFISYGIQIFKMKKNQININVLKFKSNLQFS